MHYPSRYLLQASSLEKYYLNTERTHYDVLKEEKDLINLKDVLFFYKMSYIKLSERRL